MKCRFSQSVGKLFNRLYDLKDKTKIIMSFKVICKNLKRAYFVALTMILLQACPTKPVSNTTDVTINININENTAIFQNILMKLRNNENNFERVVLWESPNNKLIFKDSIEFGEYTLIMNLDYIIDDNIIIKSKKSTHDVYIDFENINHKQISIKNETGYSIQSIFIKNYGGLPWISNKNLVDKLLLNDETLNVIFLGSQNLHNIRLFSVEGKIYTKHGVCIIENNDVIFTIDDIDGEEIKDFIEIRESNIFNVFITAYLPGYFRISTNIRFTNICLMINNEEIELYPAYENAITDFIGEYFFIAGNTYFIEFITKNPDMNASVHLKMVQDMILDFPIDIDDKDIILNWELKPDDNTNIMNSFFYIVKFSHEDEYWNYSYILHPDLRSYIIKSDFVPSPIDGYTRIYFYLRNYSVSGSVAFTSFGSYTLLYIDGKFIDLQINSNQDNFENNSFKLYNTGGIDEIY